MSKELNKAPVEQAGGDERAAFEAWLAQAMSKKFEPEFDLAKYEDSGEYRYSPAAAYWKAWQARAALAQPSPAQTQPSPAPTLRAAIDVANDRFEVPVAKWGTDLVGEEERPEVAEVAFVLRNIGAMDAEDIDGDNVDLRFEDAEGRDTGCDVSIVEYAEKAADLFEQHDRIVGELRADRDSWAEQAEQRLADWDEMRKERDAALAEVERLRQFERICEGLPQDAIDGGWTVQGIRGYAKHLEDQLKVALARVAELESKLAELEKQEPVALANRGIHAFWVKWTEAAAGLYGPGIKLYAHPVAQAQHSVPEGVTIERDVAGTIHIKVGDFDFIQLQYQRPYTDNASTWKLAERIASLLAAAPGKEGL